MKKNNNITRQLNSLWGSLWDAVTSNYTIQSLWSGNEDEELTAKDEALHSDWLRLQLEFNRAFDDGQTFLLSRRVQSNELTNTIEKLQEKKSVLYKRMSLITQERISRKEASWFEYITNDYKNHIKVLQILSCIQQPKAQYWYEHAPTEFKNKLTSDKIDDYHDDYYHEMRKRDRDRELERMRERRHQQQEQEGIYQYQEQQRIDQQQQIQELKYQHTEPELPLNQSTGDQQKLTPDEIIRKAEQDIEKLKEKYSRIDFSQPEEKVKSQENRIFALVKAAEKVRDAAKSSNIKPVQQPKYSTQSLDANRYQSTGYSSNETKLLRSQYWYQDNDITLILNNYLVLKGLHIIKVQQDPTKRGLILTQEQKLYKVIKKTTQYSVSLGEPLVKGGSAAWESILIDLLYQTIKAVVDWNQALLQEGILPDSAKEQVIDNHYIAIPYCINNRHWITMLLNFSLVKTGSVYHPAEAISVTCYDSLNMAQKITDETISFFRAAFTNALPKGIKIDFKFSSAVLKVAQQPDGSSCGVLTTDRIKNLIYGDRLGVMIGDIEKLDTKRILALREEHMLIADNEFFNQKQLGEIRDANISQQSIVTNYQQQQQNLIVINATERTIYTCIMHLPKELGNEVYLKVQEFIFAFDLLEKLNLSGSNINLQDPRYNNLLSVYNDKYEEHKSTIRSKGQEFVENNGEKLFFCADFAVRDKLKDLKNLMLKYKEDLHLIWTTIFNEYKENPEDLTWKDNGQDNFAAALKKVLERISIQPKQTEVVVPSKPDIKMYPKTQSDEEIPMLQQPTEGYVEEESDAAMEVCKEGNQSDGFDEIYQSAADMDDCDIKSTTTNISGSYVDVSSVEGVDGKFQINESTTICGTSSALRLYDTIVAEISVEDLESDQRISQDSDTTLQDTDMIWQCKPRPI